MSNGALVIGQDSLNRVWGAGLLCGVWAFVACGLLSPLLAVRLGAIESARPATAAGRAACHGASSCIVVIGANIAPAALSGAAAAATDETWTRHCPTSTPTVGHSHLRLLRAAAVMPPSAPRADTADDWSDDGAQQTQAPATPGAAAVAVASSVLNASRRWS